MFRILLLAGAAAMALSAPATAERGGNGKDRGQSAKVDRDGGKSRAQRAERRGRDSRVERRAERRSNDRRGGAMRIAKADDDDRRRVTRSRGGDDDRRRAARRDRGDDDNRRRVARVDRDDDNRRRVVRVSRDDDNRRRAVRVDRDDDDRRRVVRVNRNDDRRIRGRDWDDDRRIRFADRDDDDRRRFRSRGDDDDRRRFRFRDDDDRWVRGFANGLVDGCPPGLRGKNPLCMPPGQYKKLVGNRIPAAFSSRQVPNFLRDIYRDDRNHYYRWNDGLVYRVNRETNLIASLIPLFGGGLTLGQAYPTTWGGSNYLVPTAYRSFYPDYGDDYYRYSNGYVYEIDRDNGLIEDIIPLYDRGYGMGQMLPASYGYYNLPYPYRNWYEDDDDYYYRYAPGAIYQVDRDTQLISAVASLLTGGLGVGQQLPMSYGAYNVPLAYRDQYYDTPDSWYRYANGNIYQVDPTTQLITAVIQALV